MYEFIASLTEKLSFISELEELTSIFNDIFISFNIKCTIHKNSYSRASLQE